MIKDNILVEKILTRLEGEFDPDFMEIDGYTSKQICHHVHLLKEGGYIEAINYSGDTSPYPEWVPTRLKNAGHDYLSRIRKEKE